MSEGGPGNDIGHRERFPTTRNTKQCLCGHPLFYPFNQLLDSRRLIAGSLKRLMQFKRRIGISNNLSQDTFLPIGEQFSEVTIYTF